MIVNSLRSRELLFSFVSRIASAESIVKRICVGVRSGVTPGERVVTRGAYDVQLAAAAGGLPAEGHVH